MCSRRRCRRRRRHRAFTHVCVGRTAGGLPEHHRCFGDVHDVTSERPRRVLHLGCPASTEARREAGEDGEDGEISNLLSYRPRQVLIERR